MVFFQSQRPGKNALHFMIAAARALKGAQFFFVFRNALAPLFQNSRTSVLNEFTVKSLPVS